MIHLVSHIYTYICKAITRIYFRGCFGVEVVRAGAGVEFLWDGAVSPVLTSYCLREYCKLPQ